MPKITTSDFQKGIFVEFKGEICQIVEFQHVNPGKGSAFIRTKLKNIKSGNTVEFTYKSGEEVIQIPVSTFEMQFLYKDNDNYIFMNNKNYEQMSLNKNIIGSFANFLKEGENYQILIHNGLPIGMRYPKKVRLLVTIADQAIRGNTVMGAKKLVTVETGLSVTVPLFIKKGDLIAVDPQTGQYLERVNI